MGHAVRGSGDSAPEWEIGKISKKEPASDKKVNRSAMLAIGRANSAVENTKMLLASKEFKESTKEAVLVKINAILSQENSAQAVSDLQQLLNTKQSGIPKHISTRLQEALTKPMEENQDVKESDSEVTIWSAVEEMEKKVDTMQALYIEQTKGKRPSDYMEKLSSYEEFWNYKDAFEKESKSKTCDALRQLAMYEGLVEAFQAIDDSSSVALPDLSSSKENVVEKLEQYIKAVKKKYPECRAEVTALYDKIDNPDSTVRDIYGAYRDLQSSVQAHKK